MTAAGADIAATGHTGTTGSSRDVADIVIIGGGVIGASCAHHLAARGATRVVLVERGAICSGETAKSGGFIQTHWDRLSEVRLIRHAREVFADWGERIGGDCGWRRDGYLHVTGKQREPHVRAVHQMLLAEGLESHWLDPAALRELQPLLNTDDLVGGAWEPSSGWADPRATTLSLVASARRRGVDVREGVRVTRIAHAGGRVTAVETDAGPIACRVAVLATGPWTGALHALPELPLPLQNERGQVTYLTRPGGLPEVELGFYDEVTGLYTHPDGETNLVGIDWPFEQVADPEAYDRELDPAYLRAARSKLAHRFPKLLTSKLAHAKVGLYDFTPDGQPIIDGPIGGLTGYYVACGFSGVGFKSAPATGLGLAELVLDGRPSSVDLSHLRLARFAPSSDRPPTAATG